MKLPRGLTRTPHGWRLRVCVNGRWYRKRYPLSVSREDMERKLHQLRGRTGAGASPVQAGRFGADVTRYLAAYYQGRPGYAERKRHLELWEAVLGSETWRESVTREQISTILHGWLASGLHPETCNKRRTALLAMYHALDGRSAANPVREVPKFRVPAPAARGLDYRLIEKAFARMPKCRTRARLKVMAYTGARHVELMRVTPDDWDTRRKTLLLQATAKGAGTRPRLVPLSAQATDAMREFDETQAWGRFSWAPMARMWKAAATHEKVGLPKDVKPYDLRHSFLSRIYRATGDLRAAKELGGHASTQMTERYTLAAVPERAASAVRAAFAAKVTTEVTKRRKSA